jgi:hypothetical protein
MFDVKKLGWAILTVFFLIVLGLDIYDGHVFVNPLGPISRVLLVYVCFKKSTGK